MACSSKVYALTLILQTLTEEEVSNIMRQVVEGMKYLHSHNIIHRDISLSNLLLTRDMQVVSVVYYYDVIIIFIVFPFTLEKNILNFFVEDRYMFLLKSIFIFLY